MLEIVSYSNVHCSGDKNSIYHRAKCIRPMFSVSAVIQRTNKEMAFLACNNFFWHVIMGRCKQMASPFMGSSYLELGKDNHVWSWIMSCVRSCVRRTQLSSGTTAYCPMNHPRNCIIAWRKAEQCIYYHVTWFEFRFKFWRIINCDSVTTFPYLAKSWSQKSVFTF